MCLLCVIVFVSHTHTDELDSILSEVKGNFSVTKWEVKYQLSHNNRLRYLERIEMENETPGGEILAGEFLHNDSNYPFHHL